MPFSAAILAGGFIPASVHGTTTQQLFHICDVSLLRTDAHSRQSLIDRRPSDQICMHSCGLCSIIRRTILYKEGETGTELACVLFNL